MKGRLIGAGITVAVAVIGAATYGFMVWETAESERQHALCNAVQQHRESLETRARAMAVGLSEEAYAEAEKAQVGQLISALDTAKNDTEVEAVIDAHAAALEAQVSATDAELKNQGSQLFLEQQLKKQRITTDIKQEIKRAEKAVTDACE